MILIFWSKDALLKSFEVILRNFRFWNFMTVVLFSLGLHGLPSRTVCPGKTVRTKSICDGWLLMHMYEVYLYYWPFTKCPKCFRLRQIRNKYSPWLFSLALSLIWFEKFKILRNVIQRQSNIQKFKQSHSAHSSIFETKAKKCQKIKSFKSLKITNR